MAAPNPPASLKQPHHSEGDHEDRGHRQHQRVLMEVRIQRRTLRRVPDVTAIVLADFASRSPSDRDPERH